MSYKWLGSEMYGRDVLRCFSVNSGKAVGYVERYSNGLCHASSEDKLLGEYLTETDAKQAVERSLRPWFVRWFT